jgi:O-antigen ligase
MKSKILPFLFYAFCFILPLSPFLNARLLFGIVMTGFFLLEQKFFPRTFLLQSWDLLLFFLVLIAGLVYSTDVELGLRQLETSLSLIGVPLMVYSLNGFPKEKMAGAYYAFAAGAFIASMICIVNALISFSQTGQWAVFFFNNFTEVIDSHPTYFAYYLIFVITYGLYLLYYELPKRCTLFSVTIIVFFFLILLLTGGQTAFISILLIFSFFVSKYLLGQKTKRTSLVAVLVLLLLTSMFSVVVLFQRIDEFHSLSNLNDYWERMELWQSAIHANTNPLIGVGTGDYNLVLNDYYRTHSMAQFADGNLNSHNQFVQLYFSNGLIGLLALLTVLGRPLYLSVRSQNLMGILLYFPFLIYSVTEVFLGRYQGVVFISFVHQMIISNNMAAKPVASFLKVAKL